MKVHLSDGEWKLMNKLWDASPRTITELTAALRGDTGWSKNTVITMLSRLEGKGAVYYEEGVRAKQYYPAVTREEAIREESESVLEKVGSVGFFMSAMVESQRLTESDLAELSAILERAKEGRT